MIAFVALAALVIARLRPRARRICCSSVPASRTWLEDRRRLRDPSPGPVAGVTRPRGWSRAASSVAAADRSALAGRRRPAAPGHRATRPADRRPGRSAARRRRSARSSRRTSAASLLGLGVVAARVRPRRARIEDLGRDVRTARRDLDAEDRVDPRRDVVELAVERRPDHRPGVGDVHPLAGPVRAAGPAGVDEPDRDVPRSRAARSASRAYSPGWRGMNGAPKQAENVAFGSLIPTSVPASLAV